MEVSYAARNYEQFQIEFIHTYPHFYHSPKNKVVKTWLKFKFRINNICSKICSTNIAAFLLCLPKIIYYLQIVTVRPHLQYFLLLLSTQGRRKLPKAGWASSNETIFSGFFQSLANFPAKGLLARKGPFLKIVIFHFYL